MHEIWHADTAFLLGAAELFKFPSNIGSGLRQLLDVSEPIKPDYSLKWRHQNGHKQNTTSLLLSLRQIMKCTHYRWLACMADDRPQMFNAMFTSSQSSHMWHDQGEWVGNQSRHVTGFISISLNWIFGDPLIRNTLLSTILILLREFFQSLKELSY